MVDIDIPRNIGEADLIGLLSHRDLLIQSRRSLDFNQAKNLDWQGTRSFGLAKTVFGKKNRDLLKLATLSKLSAAMMYEAMSEDASDGSFIFKAATCYDKSAKNAYCLGFEYLDFRCSFRAAKLYHELISSEGSTAHLDRAFEFVTETITRRFNSMSRIVYPSNHQWFVSQLREAG